jgi:hypothetical protein
LNISHTITPKSTQLNADDLICGPRTVKITSVEAGSAEQPVAINYEGDNGRPYLPSKSMRRVLVAAWGSDGEQYIGRRLTIYRDPLIRFGGEAVGGICISHLSDIEQPMSIALTVTRGKRKPFKVEPLQPDAGEVELAQLAARGDTAAEQGTDALKAFWDTITKEQRVQLKSKLEQWKMKAGGAA